MKPRDCLEEWGLSRLKTNLGFREGAATKWHRHSLAGVFQDAARYRKFRKDHAALQPRLPSHAKALAAMANVEDLTALESADK